MTIERSRSAALPSVKSGVEDHLLRDIRAVGLPEPVRELHFMWCCEHSKVAHLDRDYEGYPRCLECAQGDEHAYRHDRDFRFDLAWPDVMLAVEVDGGTYSGGRHTRGAGYESDCEKGAEALLRGWRVLRVTTRQVEDGSAVAWIERFLAAHP